MEIWNCCEKKKTCDRCVMKWKLYCSVGLDFDSPPLWTVFFLFILFSQNYLSNRGVV